MTTTLQTKRPPMVAHEILVFDPESVINGLSHGVTDFEESKYLLFESISEMLRYLTMLESGKQDSSTTAIVMPLEMLSRKEFEIVKRIRRHVDMKHIPVIALSSNVTISKEIKGAAIKNGIDDIYTKPVSIDMINKCIEQISQLKLIINQSDANLENASQKLRLPMYKRAMDIVLAVGALVLAFIPFFILAVFIRLDSKGPVFYSQPRRGMNGRKFQFWKFRSMYTNADQRLAELAHLNQYAGKSAFFKIENDPRITNVGRKIRNSSIDELPQIWNVLRGDMSIVGNRPLPLYEARELTKDSTIERYLAPAGMTGLWQVNKRGGSNDMSDEERVALDIEYARNYTLRSDINIIWRTPRAMIQKSNV
jgi:lipopolysaccharide/colanic/teichoic acid biosynthesis glycosyltransferase/flagellar assembly factor FliW